jgi:hypothetical protein
MAGPRAAAEALSTYEPQRRGRIMSRSRTQVVAAVAVVSMLVAVQAALAESPVVRFNAKDQAAARAAVLRARDIGAGWKGGFEKAKVESPDACPGLWEPKQADLVITGLAESMFQSDAYMVVSSAQLYRTARMLALDWKRTVVHPAAPRCVAKHAAAGDQTTRLVSFKRVPFPALAQYSARFRLIVDQTVDSGETVRMLMDTVTIGRGRTALALALIAPYSERADAQAAEIRLAKIMLARIPR